MGDCPHYMNFYQTTKLILFLLVPAVLIGLIFLIFAGQVGVYDSLYYISSPFFKVSSAAAGWFKIGGDFIFEFKSIRGEYERLKKENSELLSRLSESAEIKTENAVLKNQIEGHSAFFGQKSAAPERKFIFAEIIGRSRALNEKTIVINKGKQDGVAENQPFVYGNFFAGRAVKVYANHSVAALIGDPSLKISAVAQNYRAQGIVAVKNGALTFSDVSKSNVLVPGELVATLGFDGLPKGLILGEIAEVSNADNELFQSAAVKPLLDIWDLESGFVIVD